MVAMGEAGRVRPDRRKFGHVVAKPTTRRPSFSRLGSSLGAAQLLEATRVSPA
jgi:hypothetical protein